MNSFYTEIFHKFRPFSFSLGFHADIKIYFMSDVHEGFFNEPTHHPWVRPTAGNGSSLVVLGLEVVQEGASESIVASN